MESVQSEIRRIKPVPLGNDLAADIRRIEWLIRRRLGACSDEVSEIVSEVLAYHVYASISGLYESVESAAISLGEDMRISLSKKTSP